jgi:hypothetical protein
LKQAPRFLCSAGFAAVLTVLLLNGVLAAVPDWNVVARLRDPDRLLWFQKIKQVREGAPSFRAADLLILGDSQAMSGIVPEILDQALGTRSINLGMPSQQPEGLLALARLLPDSTTLRRRVVLNINPFSLFQSPVMQSFRYYYRSELARYAPGGSGNVGEGGPGHILHQYLLRFPLYEANYILAPLLGIGEAGLSQFSFAQIRARPELLPASAYDVYLAGESPDPFALVAKRWSENRWLRRTLQENRGFWTWKKIATAEFDPAVCRDASPRADMDLSFQGTPGGFVYPPRPAAVAAYREVLGLLEARGYEIWITEIPFSPAYANLVNIDEVYRRVDQSVADILRSASRPGSLRRMRFPDAVAGAGPGDAVPRRLREARYFHDLTHLSACGAGYYSRWLAGEMARRGF